MEATIPSLAFAPYTPPAALPADTTETIIICGLECGKLHRTPGDAFARESFCAQIDIGALTLGDIGGVYAWATAAGPTREQAVRNALTTHRDAWRQFAAAADEALDLLNREHQGSDQTCTVDEDELDDEEARS